ncbi:glucosaminidase, partial [Candidatus Pelagibacter sp.]|nr:glucosaminidase [Candidatus Pelagibacter sp.]
MSKKIIIRKKLTSFSGTEKNLKKINKLKIEESVLVNLSRTFLSSLIIVSIFFIAPLAINLTKEKMIFSKDYENNSKNNLKKLLENKTIKLDEKLNK